eukprot:3413014-Pleurochrysis_carterae.AAC.1
MEKLICARAKPFGTVQPLHSLTDCNFRHHAFFGKFLGIFAYKIPGNVPLSSHQDAHGDLTAMAVPRMRDNTTYVMVEFTWFLALLRPANVSSKTSSLAAESLAKAI